MNLLTVSGDAAFAATLNAYLARYGFSTHAAVAEPAALRAQLDAQAFDIVLLDLPPQAANRLALAHQLRLAACTPFILLGAGASSAERVEGLDVGAADCLAMPFEPRELVARIRSVLRRVTGRHAPSAGSDAPQVDGWVLQTLTRRLTSPHGEPVALSAAEFRLLHTFAGAPQQLFSRDQLMAQACGQATAPVARRIDLLVSRLRQKLAGAAVGTAMIKTVRGQGYVLDVPAAPLSP